MAQPISLVLPDAGPLISLATADRLDLLDRFEVPVATLDVVKSECLFRDWEGRGNLERWFGRNEDRIEIIASPLNAVYLNALERYEPGAQWLHWITAALVFTIIPLGWVFAEFKTKGDPPSSFEAPFPGPPVAYATAHKSIGLIIFALIILRIVYRLMNPPPALPIGMGGLQRGLSHASHWLLYLVLFCMPISGYVASSGGKHPISFLGLFDLPKLPVSHDIGKQAAGLHVAAQWILLALIALHLGATAWHLFVRRDAILDRMLPRQANAE